MQSPEGGRIFLHDGVVPIGAAGVEEGWTSEVEDPEEYSKWKNVSRDSFVSSIDFSLKKLGRHVHFGALFEVKVTIYRLNHAKIAKFDLTTLRNENIFELDVHVGHASFLVKGFKTLTDLQEDKFQHTMVLDGTICLN